MFTALLWAGIGLSILGMALIVGCIFVVWRAKKAGLDETAMHAKLQRVVTLNLAAMGLAGLGLMMVLVGAIMG